MTSALSGPALPDPALPRAGGPAFGRVAGELFRFGVVGVVGFLVDAGVLTAGIALGTGPWFGRVLSYVAAASTTYALNRAWTFRSAPRASGRAAARQWALFLAVNLIGFVFNYGTYAALLATVPLVAAHPVLGVAAGSLAGMVANFFVTRRFVFGAANPCAGTEGASAWKG
ncbi:GtrA family protein [Belnapia sp. T6]|uniref:GtrA family protein n=1 Tax=Belnapia mucosa TaxID=2804532 RepID=A0ABS1V2K2_9PROT|nr:GtrA family protein [Belnapia mucosa]MBL6455928.1 GtrA family protein [Belnapia mucosa]